MSEHLAGPWVVERNSADADRPLAVKQKDGYRVADIRLRFHGVDLANARLIASAPALLEALEGLLSAEFRAADVDAHNVLRHDDCAVCAALSAIRRAVGGRR